MAQDRDRLWNVTTQYATVHNLDQENHSTAFLKERLLLRVEEFTGPLCDNRLWLTAPILLTKDYLIGPMHSKLDYDTCLRFHNRLSL